MNDPQIHFDTLVAVAEAWLFGCHRGGLVEGCAAWIALAPDVILARRGNKSWIVRVLCPGETSWRWSESFTAGTKKSAATKARPLAAALFAEGAARWRAAMLAAKEKMLAALERSLSIGESTTGEWR